MVGPNPLVQKSEQFQKDRSGRIVVDDFLRVKVMDMSIPLHLEVIARGIVIGSRRRLRDRGLRLHRG